MRNREQNRQLLTQLGQHLGLEVHIVAPARRQKLQVAEPAAAEIEWRLPMDGRVNLPLIRQFVPDFPESLPLAGFVLADDSDREARQFYDLEMLSSQRYALGFLITEGAVAYRRAHRSLRTFRHLFGAGQCLVADVQQLEVVLKQLATKSEVPEAFIPGEIAAPVIPEKTVTTIPKTWTKQIKTLLRQKGQQAGLRISENAVPIDFVHHFENGRQAFATVQRYLQPVLLEEIGHALGYYHSFAPLNNRPPRVTTSWAKQFAAIKLDVIWQLDMPASLLQFLHRLLDLDFALRHAVSLLQGVQRRLPLIGFIIERTIAPSRAGRILMLSRGCRCGVVITPQSQVSAGQQLFGILGRTIGLANVSIMARQHVLEIKE